MKQGLRLSVSLVVAMCLAPGVATAQVQQTSDAAPVQGASNITSYTPDFFAQFRPNTALDMVTRVPGFSFRDSGGGRGFSGSAGNVLIDGERPPSRSDSLGSVVARIPAGGVERIDVIRGGAEGIDMQGLPIVVNVIRKADTGVTGAVSAALNVNDAGDVSPNSTLQMRNQADSQLLEGSVSISHGEGSGENVFVRRTLDGDVLRQGVSANSSVSNRISATGSWEMTALGGKLRLNGQATAAKYKSKSTAHFPIPGGGQNRAGEGGDVSGEAGIRYSRNLDGNYALEVVAFQSLGASDSSSAFRSAGVVGQADYTSGSSGDTRDGESIVRATLQSPSMGEWSFESGGEMVFNFSERDAAFSLNGAPFELGGDRNRVEELRTDGFAMASWAPSAQFNLEAGSRFEWSRISAEGNAGASEKSLTYVKPRVNASWTPEQGAQLGLRVERKVDQLDFGSFASSAAFEEEIFGIGNPDAEPEKLWETELRYERQFGGQNSLVLSYRHTLVEDVLGRAIVVVPGTPSQPSQEFEITRNGGEAMSDVLSLSGSFELDAWGLPGGILAVGGSLVDSEVTDPVTGEIHARDWSNPWTWNVSLQQTLGSGDFRWNVNFQDNSSEGEWRPHYVNTFKNGPHVSAGLSWKPWDGWSFGANVGNVIADDSMAYFDFYDTARTPGALPDYREANASKQRRNVSLSVRKNF